MESNLANLNRFKEFKLGRSLDALRRAVQALQYDHWLWWITDKNQKARQRHPNAVTIWDQIDVGAEAFEELFKSKWGAKVFKNDIFRIGFKCDVDNGCNFVTIVDVEEASEFGRGI